MAAERSRAASNPTVLSVDLGRTSTKACVSRDPNSVVLIPANVAQLSTEQVRRGVFDARLADPLLDMWLEYQGRGYALGQLAADFGADLGLGSSKLEGALVKVFASIGYFGLSGEVSVVLGLPYQSQEQFERDKAEVQGLLQSPHVMSYRGEEIAVDIKQV